MQKKLPFPPVILPRFSAVKGSSLQEKSSLLRHPEPRHPELVSVVVSGSLSSYTRISIQEGKAHKVMEERRVLSLRGGGMTIDAAIFFNRESRFSALQHAELVSVSL